MSDIGAIPSIIFDVIQQQRALHPDRPVLIVPREATAASVSVSQGEGVVSITRPRRRGRPTPP